MSVENHTDREREGEPAPIVVGAAPPRRRALRRGRRSGRPPRPRVRKLRLLFVLSGFGLLAVISTLFGALTSIASDLPKLQNTVQFSHNVDSYMYDSQGNPIGPTAPASTPAIDGWSQISQNMVHAIVAVEDHGFWGESGISVRGLARAALADLTGGRTQGASTIPEEFIKNVRQEEGRRTVAEKLVEAAMAFQLSHHWSHKRILTEYLNTIYFGNGALGVEAAARVYFGWAHGYNPQNPDQGGRHSCGNADPAHPRRPECASVLTAAQAALLAGMVANPSAFNPAGGAEERAAARARRNLVLYDMYQQRYISRGLYEYSRNRPLPTSAQIRQPEQQPSAAPYFTGWVEPQILTALEREGLSRKQAQYEAYYGGLRIHLSIDLALQRQAQQVIDAALPAGQGLPSAALVAIDNRTGEVRAMVSGENNYAQTQFNLATMGYRQPGSAFKIFTLAAALSEGRITPYTLFDSRPVTIHWFYDRPGNAVAAPNGTGRFRVRNFGNSYAGETPLTVATAVSDNSVFAQLGTEIGTGRIAQYAKLMGIRSPISPNPSMILGGLNHGVSALDMAHAYSTVADGGVKVYNPILGDSDEGPVGIDSITDCRPCRSGSTIRNVVRGKPLYTDRVLSPTVASTISSLLHGPVDDSYGTGTAAAIPGVDVAGKTGTTSNYADAWFVGWTPQMTVAVWVGYPNGAKPMTTDFYGKPVEGGTFPARIWHDFMVGALQVLQNEQQHRHTVATTVPAVTYTGAAGTTASTTTASTAPTTSTASTTSTTQTTVTTPATATTTTPAGGSVGGGGSNSSGFPSAPATPPQAGATTPAAPAGTATTGSGGSGL